MTFGTEINLAEQTILADGCETPFQFRDGWAEHFDGP
jgi:hypothetical protein